MTHPQPIDRLTGQQEGVAASPPGHQPTASAAGASSQSGVPNAVADVLERAAEILTPRGAWTQGVYGLYDGPCCAVGAIVRAGGFASARRAEDWLDRNASDALGMDALELEDWNDRKRRRKGEVVAKLREAAAKAREQAA